MTIKWGKRPKTFHSNNDGPSISQGYLLNGIPDAPTATAYAYSLTPTIATSSFGLLYRGSVTISDQGHMLWHVDVTYSRRSSAVGSVRFSFDTSGGTVRIKYARQHVATYGGSADGNPHRGLIGVTKDGDVEGADIIIPALRMSYVFRHPAGVVNEARAQYLANITGYTNSAPWRAFAAGECLFLGATGSGGTDAEAEIGYSILCSANATGLTIGSISGVAKKGHDWLWIEYKEEEVDGHKATQPRLVHIERVYNSIDFTAALGF